jgi:hypothetical protein
MATLKKQRQQKSRQQQQQKSRKQKQQQQKRRQQQQSRKQKQQQQKRRQQQSRKQKQQQKRRQQQSRKQKQQQKRRQRGGAAAEDENEKATIAFSISKEQAMDCLKFEKKRESANDVGTVDEVQHEGNSPEGTREQGQPIEEQTPAPGATGTTGAQEKENQGTS